MTVFQVNIASSLRGATCLVTWLMTVAGNGDERQSSTSAHTRLSLPCKDHSSLRLQITLLTSLTGSMNAIRRMSVHRNRSYGWEPRANRRRRRAIMCVEIAALREVCMLSSITRRKLQCKRMIDSGSPRHVAPETDANSFASEIALRTTHSVRQCQWNLQ